MNALQPSSQADTRVAALVTGARALVSPPEVFVQVTAAVSSNTADAHQIGLIVSRDPSLTARLLGLVNSSYYGFRSPIETIERAVNVVGTRELVNIVTAISAVRSFSGISAHLINMDSFWRHSLYCGLVARHLAKRRNVLHPDRLFVGGLLHDIGNLIIVHQQPEIAAELLLLADKDEDVLADAEMETLGFTHGDVGAVLLGEWRLSMELQRAVRHHHADVPDPTAAIEAGLIRLANQLANATGIGGFFERSDVIDQVDNAHWQAAGLDPAIVDSVLAQVTEEFAAAAAALLPE